MRTKYPLNDWKSAVILISLALPLFAQAGQHHRYRLIDLGTLGGPSSTFESTARTINNQGTAVGAADTAAPDLFAPNCFGPNCFVQHAFQWRDGVLTDLGALAEGVSSFAVSINGIGDVAGLSQNGLIDPLTGTPEQYAVVWNNGQIINLGSLGGNGSAATAINNRNQVVGGAANTVSDPFSLLTIIGGPTLATQTRAFLWENGAMRDLGTLGGPDSFAWFVNEGGQIAGVSYTDSTPNDTTGIPTVHPFLWKNGRMLDLGSLGGTYADVYGFNNRGQVVGPMTLPGDEIQHPYLWSDGALFDLGTLGGSNGEPRGVNESGEVVGLADLPNGLHNGFLWKSGVMTDLGNLGLTSAALAINSKGQVVGGSRVSRVPSLVSAFLWEKGGPMINLNTLIPANSSLHLTEAFSINERGEIMGRGVPPGISVDDVETLGHAFVLIPVGQE
jgi:probable HAF family extracellular repeat protein